MPCFTPLAGWVNRDTGGLIFKRPDDGPPIKREVACGQCLGCRLDKSREWAARIVHESQQFEDNCFITLTYRDFEDTDELQRKKGWYVPKNGSLVKQHFQKFMKRLRKEFESRRIRYYHCGEYGEKMDRPHYHACLFNFDFTDKELFQQKQGLSLFTSDTLGRLWPYGFSTIGDLSFESAAYCARYVTKKVTGQKADEWYLRSDEYGVAYWLEPEYNTMSRRPGLGYDWYKQYKTDVFPSDELPIPGVGVVKKVPRYYTEILRKEDEEEWQAMKDKRAAYLKAHIGDFSPERLKSKYLVAAARQNLSYRSYEE